VWTLDRPAVFPVTKDRPILFSALAWADVLLTLDRNDFAELLGSELYGLAVLKPGSFLEGFAPRRAPGRKSPNRRLRGIGRPIQLLKVSAPDGELVHQADPETLDRRALSWT
jgi:hypothetical protein